MRSTTYVMTELENAHDHQSTCVAFTYKYLIFIYVLRCEYSMTSFEDLNQLEYFHDFTSSRYPTNIGTYHLLRYLIYILDTSFQKSQNSIIANLASTCLYLVGTKYCTGIFASISTTQWHHLSNSSIHMY